MRERERERERELREGRVIKGKLREKGEKEGIEGREGNKRQKCRKT